MSQIEKKFMGDLRSCCHSKDWSALRTLCKAIHREDPEFYNEVVIPYASSFKDKIDLTIEVNDVFEFNEKFKMYPFFKYKLDFYDLRLPSNKLSDWIDDEDMYLSIESLDISLSTITSLSG